MPSPYKLLLLDRRVRVAGDSTLPPFVFDRLPFAVVSAGSANPSDPSIVATFEHYPVDKLRVLRCLDWCLGQSVDVLNLSLGPAGTAFDPNEPLQIATNFASQLGTAVVVAAGNRGPALDTLQPLARAPWVIAVGATDANGSLVNISSRGVADGAKPTVVADGSIPGTDERFPDATTSFAAPKVSAMVVWLQKFLQLVIGDLADQHQGIWSFKSRPIEVHRIGFVDTGVDVEKLPPINETQRWFASTGKDHLEISRSDAEAGWYREFMRCFDALNVVIEVDSGPATIKRCLQLAAKPMPGFAEHDVGAGFLSGELVIDFMAGFTPSRFVDALCPHVRAQIPVGVLEQLDASLGAVWRREKCDAVAHLFGSTLQSVHCKAL